MRDNNIKIPADAFFSYLQQQALDDLMLKQMIQQTYYNNTIYYCVGEHMPQVNVEFDEEIDAYHLSFVLRGRGSWESVQGIIQVIKATIPASNREYNTSTRVWTILAADYLSLEKVLLLANFIIDKKTKVKTTPINQQEFFYSYSEPASSSRESKESLADKLIKLLGCSAQDLADSIKLKRLYRAKALEYHPDRNNGDGSRMSELNSIWSAYNA